MIKIHFIGIGGIGISALAQLCKSRGDLVSGSEIQETGISEILRKQNIEVKIPQKATNIPKNCDLIIYTEAIGADNPELLEAKKQEIPLKSYFEFLGEISTQFRTIAVAGTHGKTTTTGILTAGFLEAGFDPTIFVGSKLNELSGSNFHSGSNDFLLVEACEYRNNFQFLAPEIVLLTNVELDHIDFYQNEAHYFETFQKFCEKAKVVIFHENDQNAATILENFKGLKIAVSPEDISKLPALTLSGNHNRENAALAFACAHHLNVDDFASGSQKFSGAWRRQEYLGNFTLNDKKLLVYDDYGHHPTEIVATIQSFREKFPHQKIGLIFEPHQYSRTREFFEAFLEAFKSADLVGIFPIYAARDTDLDKSSISRHHFIKVNENIQKIDTQEDLSIFAKDLQEGDVLLFMGAGKIDTFAHSILV